MREAEGAHAVHHGNQSIFVLALCIPMLMAMLPLAIAPGVLLMAREFGDITAQLVLTLPAVLMIVGAGLCGYLAERWGRRTIIVASLLIYGISGVAGFFTTDLFGLAASRAAGGLSAGVLMTTIYAVTGEYYEGNARERLLGFMTLASAFASVALLAGMGLVVERFGWRVPFLFYAAALPLIPFALTGLHKGVTAVREVPLSWAPVLRHWPIYLLLTAYAVGMYMLVIQGPFLLEAKGITAPSIVGRLIAISSLTAGVASGFYGLARRFLGFRQMFLLISLTLGVGLPLAALAPDAYLFVPAAVITGIAMGIIEATVASELLLRTPEPLHDRAMGLNVAALYLGQFLNPLVAAPLSGIGGSPFSFQLLGFAYLAGGLLFLASIVSQRRKRFC